MHSISYISRSQIQQCLKPSEVRISRYLDYFPQGALVKNPPAMQETQEMWVQSWSRGGMATHSRNFVENLRDRGAWRANSPWDLKRVGYDWSNWVHDMFQMSCSEVCLVLRYLVCLFCRKAGGLFPRIIVGKWNSAPFSGGGLKENVASGDLTRGGQDQNHWMLRKRQESASIPKLTRFRGHCNKGNCCGYWENKKKMCENTALSQNINDSH